MSGMSPKHALFVAEYLKDLNATQAAIRAGYSQASAYSQGQRLLKHAEVDRAIREGKSRRAKRVEVSADRVLAELKAIAFSNVADIIDVNGGDVSVRDISQLAQRHQRAIESITQTKSERLSPDGGAPLETVQTKIKMHSKVTALRMLMDHIGMDAPKKTELTGANGGPLEMKSYQEMSAAELEAEALKLLQPTHGGRMKK